MTHYPLKIHFDPTDFQVFAKNCSWEYLPESRLHAASIPNTLLSADLLHLKDKFNARAFLFKFPAYTFYGWHKDRTRRCAFNYELTTGDSVTYVGLQDGLSYRNLQRISYNKQLILLDTTQYHSIANMDVERVIFTLGVYDYSFDAVLRFLLQGQ